MIGLPEEMDVAHPFSVDRFGLDHRRASATTQVLQFDRNRTSDKSLEFRLFQVEPFGDHSIRGTKQPKVWHWDERLREPYICVETRSRQFIFRAL